MRNKIIRWWRRRLNGYMRLTKKHYLVNHTSKEIHRLRHPHVNCHTDEITNHEYVNLEKSLAFMGNKEYNGCRFCFPEFDNG